ncbi:MULTISPECIES: cation-transporting P-type ATPase [unclassified Kitasatospora]|uniref:cation-transporting P-type ATPase n=1 Tax=unclassified Kitasatospora TaxID=2633591 RepID=UPI0033E7560D
MTATVHTAARGLTTAEAARLLAEHGRNEVAADRRVPLWARSAWPWADVAPRSPAKLPTWSSPTTNSPP